MLVSLHRIICVFGVYKCHKTILRCRAVHTKDPGEEKLYLRNSRSGCDSVQSQQSSLYDYIYRS